MSAEDLPTDFSRINVRANGNCHFVLRGLTPYLGVYMQDALQRVLLIGGLRSDYRWLSDQLVVTGAPFRLHWCELLSEAAGELSSGRHDVVLIYSLSERDAVMISRVLASLPPDEIPPVIELAEASTDDESQLLLTQQLSENSVEVLIKSELQPHHLRRTLQYAIDRHEVDRKLLQVNHYDPLTGIPNRLLFKQMLEQAIARAKTQQISLGLLLINLDGFKKVNESYGLDAGDELVTSMAKRLGRCVRRSDSLARVGGDEFTLILDDCHANGDVALVAQKVIEELSAPYMLDNSPLIVSCSIGVAMYPEAGDTVDGLLKRANVAMREAKACRGSQYKIYSEDSNQGLMQRINLEADLRRALRKNEFEMYYQPRVKLDTGETVGMESLIRWRHPTRGMVSPKEFIPVAEESGLIVPIGYWVIQQACEDMKRFDRQGSNNIDIAINLSFKQLQDSMFVDTATRIIQQSGIDASRLEFELTETAIMSNFQQTYEGMMALSQLGITFSLDDFGTGFSSFAHIQRLPISALKVDRSFIQSVVRDDEDAIIVKAMIDLAHSLHLNVIAEGVETLDQVQFLWQNRCDQVQGYYFSPAVTAKDFGLMLSQRATISI